MQNNSASADGGPPSRVCSHETLRSDHIDASGNFPARVSAEWPSNISPIPRTFRFFDFLVWTEWGAIGNSKHFSVFSVFFIFPPTRLLTARPRGGGQNFQKLFLSDFLAKLGSSKHFSFFSSFFSFFPPLGF